jgi:hypothetical protein
MKNMKKYSVVVTEKKTKKVILEKEELSKTLLWLRAKYDSLYKFSTPPLFGQNQAAV